MTTKFDSSDYASGDFSGMKTEPLDPSLYLDSDLPPELRAEKRFVLAERERCARIAASYPDLWEEDLNTAAHAIRKLASAEIAAAIRKGTP